ncbi:MAG: putative lipopolysaccharide heptosyltransferase III [Desulfarculus sp.]|nr:putative lipopolysaccharide heptosyltransferase III [Desulfarculus sp.]
MPPALAEPPRRALVIKLGHIGDVLVSTPVISALKRAYPGLAVTALVNQGTEAMLANNPEVERVLVLRRDLKGWRALVFQLKLLRQLRRGGFDLAIDLSGGDRGAFLALASGARLRAGFAPRKPSLRARAFHRLADPKGTQHHVVETLLRTVRSLGIDPDLPRLSLRPSPEARAKAAEILEQHGLKPRSYALVHPTSRWMFKTWTPEGNAWVIRRLLALGLGVVLTAAPAAREMAFVEQVLASLGPTPGLINLAGQVSLDLLAALIQPARVFFGVDSAPMHMAAALGVPCLVLFGPSGEKMWGPWRVASEVVTLPEDCRPCGQDGCDGSKVSRCLVQMPPELVGQALDRLLERTA